MQNRHVGHPRKEVASGEEKPKTHPRCTRVGHPAPRKNRRIQRRAQAKAYATALLVGGGLDDDGRGGLADAGVVNLIGVELQVVL